MARIKTFTNVKLSLPESVFTDPAAAYAHGCAGCWPDEAIDEQLHSAIEEDGGKWHAEDVVRSMSASDQGRGKLSLLTEEIARVFGRQAMPGPAQRRGDCVAHALKNGILGTIAAHVAAGLQGKPDVPPGAVPEGVFANELLYANRLHGGDGWHVGEAVLVAMKKTGAVVRRNYTEVGINVEKYNPGLANIYGVRPPSAETMKPFGNNLVSSATRCRTWEELRDMVSAGFGAVSGGPEGFSNRLDEFGVANRQGRWMHAMACLGVDDRPETHRRYGSGLALLAQTWGPSWCEGGRKIHGTNLEIPKGYFWARWSDVSRRDWTAISVNGWSNAKLKPWAVDV